MILRPKQFYLVSALMFLAALSFPVQVMWLYGHGFAETGSIFTKLTPLNWLVVSGLLVGSYLYFQASRGIVYFAPVFLATVFYNNYQVGIFAQDFSLVQTSFASLGAGLLFVPLLMPSSQVILKDPKRRWWRRCKRINKEVAATLNPFVGEMIQARTYDISETGAFLALEGGAQQHCPKVGDTVRLSFNINGMKRIRCEAVVIRIAEPHGRYPRGIGLRFLDFEKMHQKSFEKLLSQNEL